MIEYTYFQSGHWRVVCTVCQAEEYFTRLSDAYKTANTHVKACGT